MIREAAGAPQENRMNRLIWLLLISTNFFLADAGQAPAAEPETQAAAEVDQTRDPKNEKEERL